jgi:hypothetical protein
MTVPVTKNTSGWTPVPDPTVLTTELMLREVANLKELLQTQINVLKQEDIRVWEELSTRQPAIRAEVERLHALFDERFHSISTQFTERDKRQDQIQIAEKTAISAALQAQKESMEKTEAGFTKQIDSLHTVIDTAGKSTDGKIDDLKTRLTTIEGKSKGLGEGWGVIVAAGGLATGILFAISGFWK